MSDVKINITIKGLDKLLKDMKSMPKRLQKEISDSIGKTILLVERFSKLRTPVDTGRLRASIGGGEYKGGFYAIGTGRLIQTYSASIGPTVDYAIYVHEGTKYMNPRPFMKWGVEDATPDIKDLWNKSIQRAIDGKV